MKKPLIIKDDICELTPALLREWGVSAVLCDLDNTLAGYRDYVPDEAVGAWIQSLSDAGIMLFIVSNGSEKRVSGFCKPLGLPYIARSGKPSGKRLLDALRLIGINTDRALMAGDQFFTDVKAGQNAGVQAVLVNPKVKGFLFTARRFFEKPFIRRSMKTC